MKQKFCQRVGWALCALLCMLPTVTHGQAPCAVTVTSDFEAQCVLSDKYLFLDMNERDLIACQGMTCTYTAFTNRGLLHHQPRRERNMHLWGG